MIDLTIDIFGTPKAQPRARAFTRRTGNQVVARVYDDASAEGWKSCIAQALAGHIPAAATTEAVATEMIFYFARPASHYGTGRNAARLRPSAPRRHTSKPDRDNLEKAVLDVLTSLEMWRDDAQSDEGRVVKRWADERKPGMTLSIKTAQ